MLRDRMSSQRFRRQIFALLFAPIFTASDMRGTLAERYLRGKSVRMRLPTRGARGQLILAEPVPLSLPEAGAGFISGTALRSSKDLYVDFRT